MTVVIAWIVEGTWPACVDAARAHAPGDADIALLHVTAPEVSGAARGAYAGLLGRARPWRDPGTRLEHLAAASAGQLLADAAGRLGRPCTRHRAHRPHRAGGRGRRRRRGPAHPRPRRRPHPPRPPQPRPGQPLRRRPRPLPGPAGLARTRAQRGHHPTAATPPTAPPVAPSRVPGQRSAVPPAASADPRPAQAPTHGCLARCVTRARHVRNRPWADVDVPRRGRPSAGELIFPLFVGAGPAWRVGSGGQAAGPRVPGRVPSRDRCPTAAGSGHGWSPGRWPP